MITAPPFAQTELDELINVDQLLWDKLRGARLFLTGGTGFFGRWMLESLSRADDRLGLNVQVIALTRHPELFIENAPHLVSWKALRLIQGDVRDFDFPEENFSHIIHLAASSDATVQAADPLDLFSVIINGTVHMLDFFRRCKAERFLFVSSGAVYGQQPAKLAAIPENYHGAPDPLLCQSVYGTAKRAAEQLCCLHNSKKTNSVLIARPFAFIGPGMPLDSHFAACNFIRDGIAGGPIYINGDGTPLRSYLYASDLAWWLWKILMEGSPEQAYNVGGDKPVTILELAETVANLFSPRLPVIVRQRPDDSKQPEKYIPDVSRVREKLGLCVRISLQEALKRTIAWHLKTRRITK